MKKKRVFMQAIMSIVIIFLAISLSACSNGNTISYDPDMLNIYKPSGWKWIDNANANFLENNKQISVNTIEFDDFKAYNTKLTAELFAGRGPDVIIADVGQIEDLLKNGALANINDLIPAGFELSEYGGSIQDVGVINNDRYFFAMDYYMPLFYTAKSVVDEGIINETAFSSWNDFIELAITYANQKKYLIGGENISIGRFFVYALDLLGYEYVDYNKRTSSFKNNEKEIIKLMDEFKNYISPVIAPKEEVEKLSYVLTGVKSDIFPIVFSDKLNYEQMWINNSYFTKNMESDMVIFPFPQNDIKSVRYVNKIAAINVNSKHKKEALEYIKVLMDSEPEGYATTVIPVSEEMKDRQIYMYTKDERAGSTGMSVGSASGNIFIKSAPLPDDLITFLEELGVKSNPKTLDYGVMDIIGFRVEEFISGKKSAQETIEIIDSALNVLLQE